jgi:hypothetical protein
MKDWFIYLLCGAVFIAGVSILLFTRPQVSPSELVISGEVVSVNQKENVAFITFVPNDFLVVSFEKVPPEGDVSLVGRLQEYKGKVEFVVSDYIPKNSDT